MFEPREQVVADAITAALVAGSLLRGAALPELTPFLASRLQARVASR